MFVRKAVTSVRRLRNPSSDVQLNLNAYGIIDYLKFYNIKKKSVIFEKIL